MLNLLTPMSEELIFRIYLLKIYLREKILYSLVSSSIHLERIDKKEGTITPLVTENGFERIIKNIRSTGQ